MLKQFAHYMESVETTPAREKDVQDALEPVIRLAFPDVIREPAAPKQTKTYYPDFGFDSIATAVEIKFVDAAAEAGTAIGGLYEDMKGYAGSGFSFFIGMVYMTGNYVTQEQVEAELSKADVPKNWKVLIVVGAGGREKRSRIARSEERRAATDSTGGDGVGAAVAAVPAPAVARKRGRVGHSSNDGRPHR